MPATVDPNMVVARAVVRLWHAGVMKRDMSLAEVANICVVPLEVVNAAEAAWHEYNSGPPKRHADCAVTEL
jgi:hypothetical protein